MLSNFHSHTSFCDGDNTAEEMVISAIEKGFISFGLSGHAYTDFDLSYCIKDTDGYIRTVKELKEKYNNKIQLYLGTEEDAFCPVKNRGEYDYIIGSCHYFLVDRKHYPVDHSFDCFKRCLELFDGDILKMAENYYSNFCDYINLRKPDIIGHFDLVTKYDEMDGLRFLNDKNYNIIAEKYIKEALKSDCLFEVNTGAISRKCRTTPYPDEKLLYVINKEGGRVIISSDTHSVDTLDCYFAETKKLLKEIGFQYVYTLYNNEFIKDEL